MNFREVFGQDPVMDALVNWANWMVSADSSVDGYPTKASGMLVPSWIRDSEEIYSDLDDRLAEATDAAIDSLSTLSRLAVNMHFGFAAKVWHISDESRLFEKAKEELLPLLKSRSVL